jgi:hypothetical protein
MHLIVGAAALPDNADLAAVAGQMLDLLAKAVEAI